MVSQDPYSRKTVVSVPVRGFRRSKMSETLGLKDVLVFSDPGLFE